jgi:hypothetical protein
LLKIYPNIEQFKKDFSLFEKMIHALDKQNNNRNNQHIYLSRRGYPGAALGEIVERDWGKKKMTWQTSFSQWFNKAIQAEDWPLY